MNTKNFLAGGMVLLAIVGFTAAPAAAHDGRGDRGSTSRSSYGNRYGSDYGRYGNDRFDNGRYSRSNRSQGADKHDRKHAKAERKHDWAHDRGFEGDRRDHDRYHDRMDDRHDDQHNRVNRRSRR